MPQTFTVRLNVKERSGQLFASCADVPGLHVTGTTRDQLRSTAMRAVKDLYRRNRGLTVEVSPTDDLAELRVRTVA